MTPGPRDPCMLKHGRSNGGVAYISPKGEISFQSCPDQSMTQGPLSVRINGVPGGRLNLSATEGGRLNLSATEGGSVSPGNSGTTGTSHTTTRGTLLDQSRDQSSHITDLSHLSPVPPADLSKISQRHNWGKNLPKWISLSRVGGATVCKGALTSLGLLCLTSLLLALLALTFLLELDYKEYHSVRKFSDDSNPTVREVTLALAALTLALDLCCLLVCSAQFIFALKLIKTEGGEERLVKYLQQLSVSRIFAVGAFFTSIPIFLTGVILYTFSQFEKTPAIFIAILIGIGIIICGFFIIHSVFIWQKENSAANAQQNIQGRTNYQNGISFINSSPLPNATLDLSRNGRVHELSTLV